MEATTLNWEEYKANFDCFPEIGVWINNSLEDNIAYRVVQVRKRSVVLEVKRLKREL